MEQTIQPTIETKKHLQDIHERYKSIRTLRDSLFKQGVYRQGICVETFKYDLKKSELYTLYYILQTDTPVIRSEALGIIEDIFKCSEEDAKVIYIENLINKTYRTLDNTAFEIWELLYEKKSD